MAQVQQQTGRREPWPRRAARGLIQPLAIDVRSLAVYRIGVAAMLLVDLASRARDLADHYSDRGAFPRTARIAFDHAPMFGGHPRFGWSLHMLSGETWAQAVLFAAAACFAAGMLVGYRTRLCTIASWLFLVSLHARNPLVLDAGDTLLRTIMFWSMFLPLGAAISVDRRLGPASGSQRREVLSIGGAALLLQIAIMYWCTAFAKYVPVWNRDYLAVYYVLNVDAIVKPWGRWLLQFPDALRWLTFCTYWLEWLGPAIALAPCLARWPRACVVFAFWALHSGMALTIQLGILPWIVMVAWLAFLPSVVWDTLGRFWGETTRRAFGHQPTIGRFVATLDRSLFRRPAAPDFRLGRLRGAFVAAILGYTVVWNVSETFCSGRDEFQLPPAWRLPAQITGLEQWWFMFAPAPMTNDGWYVLKGVLEDGSVVNLWAPGEPLPAAKPKQVGATYRNQRWCRYLMCLMEPTYDIFLPDFAHWLQRRWDERYAAGRPENRVKSVEIIYQLEETPAPDDVRPTVMPVILWKSEYEAFAGSGAR